MYSRNGPDRTEQNKFHFDFINVYGQLWEEKYLQYTPYPSQKLNDYARKFIFDCGSNSNSNRLVRLEAFWQMLNNNK